MVAGQGVNVKTQSRPFFIVGFRRSGTTLLRLMMACHPRIGIPPEGGFLVILGWRYAGAALDRPDIQRRFCRDFLKIETASDWGLSQDELEKFLKESDVRSLPQAFDAIYYAYLEKNFPGKQRWGDKTTWYSEYMDEIDRFFKKARFVHLVRDGRDVAVSYKGVPHLTDDVASIGRQWALNFEIVRRAALKIGSHRILMVRYEDLVTKPEFELRRVCDFLDEEFDVEMLNFWKVNRAKGLEPERHMGWKEKTQSPVSTSSVGRWQKELEVSEVQAFEAAGGALLEQLGYKVFGDLTGSLRKRQSRQTDRRFVIWALWRVVRRLKNRIFGPTRTAAAGA